MLEAPWPLVVWEGDEGVAGRITALKAQKRNRNRVSVYLDGQYAFGLPAIVAASLKVGQRLSGAEREALEKAGMTEEAHSQALNYLSYRPRSIAEVRSYLAGRGVAESGIDQVVERLESVGLLDDAAFARYWVENRVRFRPKGLVALRYELRNKGIGEEIIEDALDVVDVADGAYRAAQRKARQLQQVDHQTFMHKLVPYLARRGFPYDVAREAAERHWTELTVGNG